MTLSRARWAWPVPLLVALASGCGEPQPAWSPPDSGLSFTDASSAPDAGDPADAAVDGPDAAAEDGGAIGPGACEGQGGYPAVEPNGAYASLESLRDQPLRDALYERVQGHTSLSYNDARRAMLNTTDGIDVHDAKIECIYTGRTVPAQGATSNNMNVEHSWPQSDYTGPEGASTSDLNHLFPSDGEANLRRSSWPFRYTDCDARGDCIWTQGGSFLAPDPASAGDRIFEVRPERRGDIARAHFYFATRYRVAIDSAEEQALRCWNWSDPPDALERGRNARVEAIQQKRNPFIDRPDFVERISDF